MCGRKVDISHNNNNNNNNNNHNQGRTKVEPNKNIKKTPLRLTHRPQSHKSVLVFSGVLSCLPKSFDAHAWWQDGKWDVYLPIRLCHDPGGEMVEFFRNEFKKLVTFFEHIHINV